MLESAFAHNPALLIPIVLFTGMTLIFVVWIIAHYWNRVRQLDIEVTLKRELLNRGTSVSDIERVLWASAGGPPAPPAPETKETITNNEYALVEKMLDDGRPVEEIERLVRALKGNGSTASRTIEEIMRR